MPSRFPWLRWLLVLLASSAWAEKPSVKRCDGTPARCVRAVASLACSALSNASSLARLVASLPRQPHDDDIAPDWLRRGYLEPTPGVRKVVLIRDPNRSLIRAELTLDPKSDLSPDDLAQVEWPYEELDLLQTLHRMPQAQTFRVRFNPAGFEACEIIGHGAKRPTATLEGRRIAYPLGAGSGTLWIVTIQAAAHADADHGATSR